MNRKHKIFDHDEAVAAVVGALLLVAIAAAAVSMYRLSWLPVAEKDREAAQMESLHDDLVSFIVALDRHVGPDAPTTSVHPIAVGRASTGFPRLPALVHELQILDETQGYWGVNFTAVGAVIAAEGGSDLEPTPETFTQISDGTNVDGIMRITHLRLKVDSITRENASDSITLVLKDAAGSPAASFELLVESAPPHYIIRQTTRNGSGAIEATRSESYFQSTELTPYFAGVLDPPMRFRALAEAASKPMRLEINATGLSGSFSMAYLASLPGGEIVPVSGVMGATITREYPTDLVVYRARNVRLPDQTWSVENGALILTQGDKATFRVDPLIDVTQVGGTTFLALTLPSLDAHATTISGVSDVVLTTRPVQRESFLAVAENCTLTISTDSPAAWRDHLDRSLRVAGVPAAAYSLSATGRNVTLELLGLGGSGAKDIQIDLHRGIVSVGGFE